MSLLLVFLTTPGNGPITVWLLAGLMGLMIVASFLLRQRLRSEAAIEECLLRLANADSISCDLIPTLAGNDQSVEGWNRLVNSALVQRLLDSADQNLATATDASNEVAGLPEIVFDSLNDGVAVTDGAGMRLFQNRAFASMLDCHSIGEGVNNSLIHELFRGFDNFADHIEELAFPDSTACLTLELHRGTFTGDGVIRVCRQSIRGEESLYLWTIRDVTQQKLAMETRDGFVSAATHELRTPLSNIRAYAETLSSCDEINLEDQHRFLNTILSEAGRLDRIIDDLLNISHMQAGGMTMNLHECQIDRMVDEVKETIRPLLESKTLNFEASIAPRLPDLVVDKDKLEAALVNLLGNAIKYTADGGRISLQVEHQASEVRFNVEDTGIGIPADELPKIFDRFFRSSDLRVHDIQGTGLGLAFAQDVARLHGGRIDVTSELNKGSRFSLVIPARAMEVVGSGLGRSGKNGETRPAQRLSSVSHSASSPAESFHQA